MRQVWTAIAFLAMAIINPSRAQEYAMKVLRLLPDGYRGAIMCQLSPDDTNGYQYIASFTQNRKS